MADGEQLQDAFSHLHGLLNQRVKQRLRLGYYVAKHPMRWLVGSFAFGFWLAQRRK